MKKARNTAIVGLLSAAALALSTASASATTYYWPGQIGTLGSGCYGEYNQIPYGSGNHVSGFIYDQQPNGRGCVVTIMQWWASDPGHPTYFSDYLFADSPGESVSTRELYYGPSGSNTLCVAISWRIDDLYWTGHVVKYFGPSSCG